jgi:hypothetical protein
LQADGALIASSAPTTIFYEGLQLLESSGIVDRLTALAVVASSSF